MSKLGILAIAGVAGTGVSLTGAYMLGAFGSSDKIPNSSIAKDLVEFKKTDGGDCVKSLFPGLSSMEGSGVSDVGSDDISNFVQNEKNKVKGCLVVNWDKETYTSSSNKWKGDFRFLWSAKQSDSKGFIVFTHAKPTTDSTGKLSWTGVAYYLEKQTGSSWQIKKKKEVTTKQMENTSIDGKFPKAETVVYSKPFWGFIESKEDMNSACGASECGTGTPFTPSSFQGYWAWEGSSNTSKTLGGWSSKFSDVNDNWWKEIYTETPWNMFNVVNGMTGEWTKKVVL